MNTKQLLFLLLCLLAPHAVQAQITITEADVRSQLTGVVTSTSYNAATFTGLDALIDAQGGNLTFDFRTATYDAGTVYTSELIECSNDLPGCTDPDFADANLIARQVYEDEGAAEDSVAISFSRVDSDGVYFLGGAARYDFDETTPGEEEFILKFVPAWLLQKLPLTMGTSWTSTTEMQNPLFEEAGFTFELEESYEVEGWGTLITPAGQADALKIRNRTVSVFSMGGTEISRDTSYTIDFTTKEDVSAWISIDNAGEINGAGYSESSTTGTPTEPGVEVPSRIVLEQNFPNPFNPSTTIAFTLHDAGPVSLRVYNLLGHEVAVLVDEVRAAGTYDVAWQAETLPSGVYFYRLQAGGTTMTRTMSLLK